jgi:hypothetical protein
LYVGKLECIGMCSRASCRGREGLPSSAARVLHAAVERVTSRGAGRFDQANVSPRNKFTQERGTAAWIFPLGPRPASSPAQTAAEPRGWSRHSRAVVCSAGLRWRSGRPSGPASCGIASPSWCQEGDLRVLPLQAVRSS